MYVPCGAILLLEAYPLPIYVVSSTAIKRIDWGVEVLELIEEDTVVFKYLTLPYITLHVLFFVPSILALKLGPF